MTRSVPGVARDRGLSAQGLQRLELLLGRGGQVSVLVLAQVKRHGQYSAELDPTVK